MAAEPKLIPGQPHSGGYHLLATVLPGLEAVAVDEIAAKLPGTACAATRRGRLLCASPYAYDDWFGLRSVDNLYALCGVLEIGPHKADLAAFTRAVAALPVNALLRDLGRTGRGRFFVNASRAGAQTYSRFEVADAAMDGLARATGLERGEAEAHELEFRLDVAGPEALLSLRLTDPSFRFRGNRTFSRAALRPPVAHALVWLSRPGPADAFCDPCCGSGSLLAERAAYPYARLLGGDLSPEAIAAARANAPGAELRVWDAAALPLDAHSIDVVACNLPWGRQIGALHEMVPLYDRLAAELQRILVPSGRAVMLTDLPDLWRRACDRTALAVEVAAEPSLKGLHPKVLAVRTRPG
ncbi:MAG TPA: methyltransferase domain-containing protein [Limnochordia bacterium]|nr:methyltransferase domain-containing protein [Limnochordia bacterium]